MNWGRMTRLLTSQVGLETEHTKVTDMGEFMIRNE